MKSKALLSLIFLFALFLCNAQTPTKIKTIGVPPFEKEIKANKKAQIIDVRTPEEFADGHINDAVNVDWQGANFVKNVEKFDKSKPVYVYCKSGRRSLKAAEKLEELGFKKIYNLDGGYLQWKVESKTAR